MIKIVTKMKTAIKTLILLPALILSLFLGFCKSDDNDTNPEPIDMRIADTDGNGLIEIATVADLNNMRYNLAGTSYDDESNDDGEGNTGSARGCPAEQGSACPVDTTGCCGYELTANIDLGNEDLNGNLPGNLNPIGDGSDTGRFTAIFAGNGHTISNLHIDTTSSLARDNYTNNAGLFNFCENTNIQDITLENPTLRGRRSVGSLCARMENATARNVHVNGGSIQGDNKAAGWANRGGLVGHLRQSQIENSSSSATISAGGPGQSQMGGLVGYASGNSRIMNSQSSGNVFDGEGHWDSMGGLVGYASHSWIINSQSSGNVSDGGRDWDSMGGLVGYASHSRIIASRSNGNVSDGGGHRDSMGGLVGIAGSSWIVNSQSSGNVSDAGDDFDWLGGMVGRLVGWQIVGSRSSGNVSDGGSGGDDLGGLTGNIRGASLIRDSFVSGQICIGELTTTTCEFRENKDKYDTAGILSNQIAGLSVQVRNCLTTSTLTRTAKTAFIGILYGKDPANANARVTDNYFDTTTATLDPVGGRITQGINTRPSGVVIPSGITDSNLTGITGLATNALQVAAAYTGWSTKRWLFRANAYPEPVYFDYDPQNPMAENPTTDTTIDVCEDIDSNDPMTDEGDADQPDCGDILSAFPRPAQ